MLYREVEEKIKSHDASLAENMKSFEKETTKFFVSNTQSSKAYVTFVDDDGSVDVISKLLPIFSAKGVPCTVASSIKNTYYPALESMNGSQLKMLQDDYGWEIANHSYSHPRLDLITGESLRHEIVDCYNVLTSYGLKVDSLVYPFGANSEEGQLLGSKYHTGGYISGGGVAKRPLKSFLIPRIALGSNYNPGENTYEFYKSKVDEAIANKGWCIFMMHVWNPAHDATQQQHLSDIIDYCLANNVGIVNLRDGYKEFGNKIEMQEKFIITNEGKYIDLVPNTDYKMISDNTVNIDTPLSYFKPYSETITKIHSSLNNTNGFPVTNGILKTFKPGFSGGNSYCHQILIAYNGSMYYRVVGASDAWGSFYKLGQPASFVATTSSEISVPANSYVAFNLPITTLIPSGVPFLLTPITAMNAETSFSYKRGTSSVINVTLTNPTGTVRNFGIMQWNVKILE